MEDVSHKLSLEMIKKEPMEFNKVKHIINDMKLCQCFVMDSMLTVIGEASGERSLSNLL